LTRCPLHDLFVNTLHTPAISGSKYPHLSRNSVSSARIFLVFFNRCFALHESFEHFYLRQVHRRDFRFFLFLALYTSASPLSYLLRKGQNHGVNTNTLPDSFYTISLLLLSACRAAGFHLVRIEMLVRRSYLPTLV
jgi:hypothetical protein